MSDIKMCDNCGNIFSVNEDGWEQYSRQSTKVVAASSHPVVTGERVMHICADCNQGEGVPAVRPTIRANSAAIEAAKRALDSEE